MKNTSSVKDIIRDCEADAEVKATQPRIFVGVIVLVQNKIGRMGGVNELCAFSQDEICDTVI